MKWGPYQTYFKMNKIQSQEDLTGKVILYRNELKGEDEKLAVCGVAFENTSVMKVLEYPINLYSKIRNIEIVKRHQRQGKKDLETTGDWYLIKEASKVEREIMERINC